MAKVGKLNVVKTDHITLGPIVEVTVPTSCTSLFDVDNIDEATTLRLNYDTATKLAKLLNKLVAEQEQLVRDSFCGAI